jgi:hypothetical protein
MSDEVAERDLSIIWAGWQAGGGAEWRIVSGLWRWRFPGDRRPQRLDMKTGTLIGTFTSTQVDFGIGWHFGRASAAGR